MKITVEEHKFNYDCGIIKFVFFVNKRLMEERLLIVKSIILIILMSYKLNFFQRCKL